MLPCKVLRQGRSVPALHRVLTNADYFNLKQSSKFVRRLSTSSNLNEGTLSSVTCPYISSLCSHTSLVNRSRTTCFTTQSLHAPGSLLAHHTSPHAPHTSPHAPHTSPHAPHGSPRRHLHTSARVLRRVSSHTGFRPSSDHRGAIGGDNRPEEAPAEGPGLDDRAYTASLENTTGLDSGVVASTSLQGGMLVLLPWVKWGPSKRHETHPDLLLQEAVALAGSLQGVAVLDKMVVRVTKLTKQHTFGPGQVDELKAKVDAIPGLSTVFVSVDVLSIAQTRALEESLQRRVVDRYWLVLAIFHQHARTKEAKLQVALAELPYIKSRLQQPTDREMVTSRIQRLEEAVERAAERRSRVRATRAKAEWPAVAVVGYTNAGKTSLIRVLSGDDAITPKDALFATLDATAHQATLECGLRILLTDTIGFIQDLPLTLVTCFNATLQDVRHADVVVHVRDAAHPDRLQQHATVLQALHGVQLPATTPVLTLDNKVDLLDTPPVSAEQPVSYLEPGQQLKCSTKRELQALYDATPSAAVSVTTRSGLLSAVHALEDAVLTATRRRLLRFTLPTGSEHVRLLRAAAGGVVEEAMEDGRSRVLCAMTERQLNAFRAECRALAKQA